MERNVCLTCPARKWVSDESRYVCDPTIFVTAKHHPNGGARLRPTNCPKSAPEALDKASQMLRRILKK